MIWPAAVAAVTRRYPFTSGCARLASHPILAKIVPIADREYWAPSPGGEILVSLADYIGRAVYFFGDLDPKITWLCKKLLKPGDCALDIGANIGLVSLLMAKLVGPTGRVRAFEPNPVVAHRLRAAIVRNGTTNIEVCEVALARKRGHVSLHVPQGNAGGGSSLKSFDGPQTTYRVETAPLDDFNLDWPGGVALIKIDVEGAEPDVFAGASRILSEVRPRAIIAETRDQSRDSDPTIIALRQHDYDYIAIRPSIFIKLDRRTDEPCHDIIAAPAGEEFERLCRMLAVT